MKKLIVLLIVLCTTQMGFTQKVNTVSQTEIDEVVVTPPLFTGVRIMHSEDINRPDKLKLYLLENIIYPEKALEYCSEGTELVQFEVSPEGNVGNIKILNSVCPEIDEEFVRVLESTNGMWKPGYNDDTPVAMNKEVSLKFTQMQFPNNRYESVTDYFLDKTRAYFVRGNKMLLFKNNPKKALNILNRGSVYMPNDKAILFVRGICHYELGNIEEARKDWAKLNLLGSEIEMSEFVMENERLMEYEEIVQMLER